MQPQNKLTEIKWNLVGILGKLFIDFIFRTSKIESADFEKVRSVPSAGSGAPELVEGSLSKGILL